LFRDFYAKVQTADPNEYVNSAKTSLNAFSSTLEQKRQKFKKQRESEEQKGADQSKDKAEASNKD